MPSKTPHGVSRMKKVAAAVIGVGMMAGLQSAPLTIVENRQTQAIICIEPEAATDATRALERKAADDLVRYIEMMSGARPSIASDPEAIAAALDGNAPLFVIGELALTSRPELDDRLRAVIKADPFVVGKRSRAGVERADGIVLLREGNRVYVAGSNTRSHYYAAVRLLNLWGCRWYLPTDIGECIPEHATLTLDLLDEAHGSPFEVRGYWLSWNGSGEGRDDFQDRNFVNRESFVSAHALGHYVGGLIPEGGTAFNVPIAEPATIAHVADQLEEQFAAGGNIRLGMDDGVYKSASKLDAELMANLHDKYFQSQMLTDNFMAFYNGVAKRLLAQHPDSPSTITFLAYGNITIPPQRRIEAASPLVADLAPIDIDPNHGMDDPRSPPRQEYRAMMYRWAEVMDGRLQLYDYDQGMLVWRDLPNPSHMAFRQDVKHYRDAGILGINTESRGAMATTFLNLHIRSQLMWNPELDVDALLAEFYPTFYGPAGDAMSAYWGALFTAWEETIVTEHEYYVIPAIYTAELVEELRGHLAAAQKAVAPLAGRAEDSLSRQERQYLERIRFTTLSFTLIDQYTAMVRAAATDGDYAKAAQLGQAAMQTRLELAEMNPTFTTRVVGPAAEPVTPGGSPAWFPGEVKQYMDLATLTDNTNGTLIAHLPLEWAFRRDPHDTGLARGFAGQKADLTYWHARKGSFATPEARKDYPTTEWEMLRSDLYAQAQGVLHPDWQSFTGYMWYKTDVNLDAARATGKVKVHFPGLFSEAWLYVNGYLVAHRPQKHIWWYNSYAFNWDVDLSGHLQAGENDITVRVHNTHHNGGLFRRPFLYEPTGE